jgi:hypothetical protein
MGYAVAHVHGHVPNGCRDRPRVGYVVSKSKETCAVSKAVVVLRAINERLAWCRCRGAQPQMVWPWVPGVLYGQERRSAPAKPRASTQDRNHSAPAKPRAPYLGGPNPKPPHPKPPNPQLRPNHERIAAPASDSDAAGTDAGAAAGAAAGASAGASGSATTRPPNQAVRPVRPNSSGCERCCERPVRPNSTESTVELL